MARRLINEGLSESGLESNTAVELIEYAIRLHGERVYGVLGLDKQKERTMALLELFAAYIRGRLGGLIGTGRHNQEQLEQGFLADLRVRIAAIVKADEEADPGDPQRHPYLPFQPRREGKKKYRRRVSQRSSNPTT